MAKKRIRDERLDKFVIPAQTIEAMNKLNLKTHDDGKEHGMALCLGNNNRIVPGSESTGNAYSINIKETCKKKGEKYVGSFHTHPRPSETKFSAMDLWSSCDVKSKIDCVGMNQKGEIECFTKKNQNKSCQDTAESLVNIEDLYLDINEEDKKILKDDLLKEVDKFTDAKFVAKKVL